MKNVTQNTLLSRIEHFYDLVPRSGAIGEPHGGLTLFLRQGEGWAFYARPTLGGPAPTVDEVRRVRERQRVLGVPQAFEWVDEVTPTLRATAEVAGLAVSLHPLMVLEAFTPVPPPPGARLRFVEAGSERLADDLAALRAVTGIGFGAPGTAAGSAGTAERDAAIRLPSPGEVAADRVALHSGALARALLDTADGTVCAGTYQRAADVVEIVGVATLPAARRRGLAAALTSGLTQRAVDDGAELVFLSAGDEDVARVYERVGFRRIATACIAEPPSNS